MKNLLSLLIESSLLDLYHNDKNLIERRASERSLTFKFAHYFQNHMKDTELSYYDVDCEYNRDGYGVKQIYGTSVLPDFILHKRGNNDNNILIIEFKTWWNPNNDHDIKKIKFMMHPDIKYGYQYGCSITLNKDAGDIVWVEGCDE